MYKLQKLIYNAAIGFAHFTNNNFTIEIDNMQKLYSDLGEDDKKAFMFDVEQVKRVLNELEFSASKSE